MVKLLQLILKLISRLSSKNILGIRDRNPRWEVEQIPTEGIFYRAVYFQQVHPTEFRPTSAAFSSAQGMSCDWHKYSTPVETRRRIGQQYKHRKAETQPLEFKNSTHYFICQLDIASMLNPNTKLPIQTIHNPVENSPEIVGIPNNRSHSLVQLANDESTRKKLDVKFRAKMSNIAQWSIWSEH